MSRKIILLKLFRNMFKKVSITQSLHPSACLLCISFALHFDYFRIYTGYVLSFLHTI